MVRTAVPTGPLLREPDHSLRMAGKRGPLRLHRPAHSLAFLALLARPRLAAAAESYLTFEDSTDVGAIKWGALALAIMVVVAIVRYQVVAYLRKRRGETVSHEVQEHPEDDFRARAQELGFRGAEYRNLKRIASRLAPKTPGALLVSTTGREYLVADLHRRALRREREIEVLEGICGRLSRLGDQPVHEREVVRLDAHLPVWVEPRRTAPPEPGPEPGPEPEAVPPRDAAPVEAAPPDPSEAPEAATDVQQDDAADSEEEILPDFDDLTSVQGKLIDFGMGGCAVEVELEASPGQIIEVWSADWEIHLPRTAGDVVSVEPPTGDRPGVLHLHFLDANEDELTAAMEDIRDREEAAARRREEGEEGAEEFGALGETGE